MTERAAASAEVRHVDIGDVYGPLAIRIRRNRRARHVRLHVDESGGVTASIPMRFALHRLDPIVHERATWLREALTRIRLSSRATEVDLRRGDPVRLLGRWHATQLQPGRRSRVELRDDCVVLTVAEGDDPYELLNRWYRGRARKLIAERVELWAREFDLRVGKLSIRDQRTRWGSCSHKADLSFNWRLVLAPLWVLDAIVVHELCHIDELNHSDRFWRLLDRRYAEHLEAADWLQQHGAALRVTRPANVQHRPQPAHGPQGGEEAHDVAAGVAAPATTTRRRPRLRRLREPGLRLF